MFIVKIVGLIIGIVFLGILIFKIQKQVRKHFFMIKFDDEYLRWLGPAIEDIRSKIKKAEAGDSEARSWVYIELWSRSGSVAFSYRGLDVTWAKLLTLYPDLERRVARIARKQERDRAYLTTAENFQRKLNAVTNAASATDEIQARKELIFSVGTLSQYKYGPEIMRKVIPGSQDQLIAELVTAVESWYAKLSTTYMSSFQAFTDLRQMINEIRAGFETYHSLGVSPPDYPEEWYVAVANHYDAPELNLFYKEPDVKTVYLNPGEFRLRAAKALQEGDLIECLIVLAYCDESRNLRETVGHVMMADLPKMVVKLRGSRWVPIGERTDEEA